MSMNSLVADSIARINNAQKAHHEFVVVKSSKFIMAILKVLKDEGYILSFEEVNQKAGINFIKIDLKYFRNEPAITSMKMISKPGCRSYKHVTKLPKSYNGLGTFIISTSHGVMADHMAVEKHIGGEIICEVY